MTPSRKVDRPEEDFFFFAALSPTLFAGPARWEEGAFVGEGVFVSFRRLSSSAICVIFGPEDRLFFMGLIITPQGASFLHVQVQCRDENQMESRAASRTRYYKSTSQTDKFSPFL